MISREKKLSTACVWAGEHKARGGHASHVPVVHSVSFSYEDLDAWLDVVHGRSEGHIYSRNTNPTVAVFEKKVQELEGGQAATSAATGMGAISSTLFALLDAGQRVLAPLDSYGATARILRESLPRFGVEVDLVETADEAILAGIKRKPTIVYLETPTNPMLRVIDIERIAAAARMHGSVVVVDNTFATPINQQPIRLGADLVIHSATKYLGGHGDAMGGVVTGRNDLIERVFAFREIHGASLHANTAYLLIRGLKTLSLRIERQNANAAQIAEHLLAHPKVQTVNYPGLATHGQHDVAARQMSGFGGMLSFSLGESFEAAKRLVRGLRYAHAAASLGAVETMVGVPATSSHVECSLEQRRQIGLAEGLVRYSVGIEDVEDLISDLDQALERV